ALKRFRNLGSLHFSKSQISDQAWEFVTEMPALHSLDTGTITDSAIPALAKKKLQALVLSGKEVTDAGMTHLRNQSELGLLTLYHTSVGDTGLARLKGLPKLYQLLISGGNVTDAGLRSLPALPALGYLSLQEMPFTDKSLAALKDLKRLTILYVPGSKITNDGLAHLAAFPNLG